MITIIQEKPSRNGSLATNIIENVYDVYKADKQSLKDMIERQNVIWCKMDGRAHYPIAHFPTVLKRDECFNYIINNSSNTVILDYNRFFTHSFIEDDKAREFIRRSNITLFKHLRRCVEVWNMKVGQLKDLDAFSSFSIAELASLTAERNAVRISEVDKMSNIWAKCLSVPKKVTEAGISASQFYKILIEDNNV